MNFTTAIQLAAILVVTFAHTVTAGPAVPRSTEDGSVPVEGGGF